MENEEFMGILNQTLSQIDEKYNTIAKSYNLTFNMLMYIYAVESSENITQKDICDALHLQKSSINSITNKFIREGYILLDNGKNKKEKVILKTEHGNRLFKEIFASVRKMEEAELSKLSASDKKQLLSICRKVNA